MSEWYSRCTACGEDVKNGRMAEHLRVCEKNNEPRTPFHGKPNDPIMFAPHEVPKT